MPSPVATATHSNHRIPVPLNEFRGFIANVLESLDWREIKTPRDFKSVTASQMEQMRGHRVHDFKYKLRIRYRKADDSSTYLDYEISEDKQKNKLKCKDKIDELMRSIDEYARESLETRAEEPVPDTYGDARFADEKELREKNFITPDTPSNRLLIAPWGEGEFLTVPVPYTNMHAMVCGPSGTGKSSGFFVPNLVYRLDNSVIVTEATAGGEIPELFADTAGWRQFKGSKVYFFNPDYAKGTRINPIDKLKYTSESEFAAVADELANLVIVNTTPPATMRADPIWDKSEKHLLWIMIMHVARSEDSKLAHFGAIRELLRKPDREIKAVLRSSASVIAREEYDSFLSHSSDNFRHGVFAGLLQRLNPWLSSVVQTMTATTDLDLDELRNERFSFYISAPSRKKYLKPIASLIFNFILDLALSDKSFKYPPALLLDEFTNFGAIPQIDDALSIIRKRGLPVVLGYQNQTQMVDLYGKAIAQKIVSNLSTRVFFRQRDAQDAESLSEMLDRQTVVEKKTDDRGHTTIRELGRPLMSVRQLQTLAPTEVIIMTEATNPIKTTRFDHESCPKPSAFQMPELRQHELISVNPLNDSTLAATAKTARAKAEQEKEFSSVKQKLDEVIVSVQDKYHLQEPNPIPGPEAVLPATAKKGKVQEPDSGTKRKIRKQVADDNWDIPG